MEKAAEDISSRRKCVRSLDCKNNQALGKLVILLCPENRSHKQGSGRGEERLAKCAAQLRDRSDFLRNLEKPLDLKKGK